MSCYFIRPFGVQGNDLAQRVKLRRRLQIDQALRKWTKSKGLYEPSGSEILMSVAISAIIAIAVVIAGVVLILMGHWYVAWVPVPVGLSVGLLITVIFRGRDIPESDDLSGATVSDTYRGGRWSKEA